MAPGRSERTSARARAAANGPGPIGSVAASPVGWPTQETVVPTSAGSPSWFTAGSGSVDAA